MAAATQTGTNKYHTQGDMHSSMAVFTAVADTNTWDSGLRSVEAYSAMIEEADDAADALTVSAISNGTLTFGVAGTIAGARIIAWGYG